jgi:hypothetical protein
LGLPTPPVTVGQVLAELIRLAAEPTQLKHKKNIGGYGLGRSGYTARDEGLSIRP